MRHIVLAGLWAGLIVAAALNFGWTDEFHLGVGARVHAFNFPVVDFRISRFLASRCSTRLVDAYNGCFPLTLPCSSAGSARFGERFLSWLEHGPLARDCGLPETPHPTPSAGHSQSPNGLGPPPRSASLALA